MSSYLKEYLGHINPTAMNYGSHPMLCGGPLLKSKPKRLHIERERERERERRFIEYREQTRSWDLHVFIAQSPANMDHANPCFLSLLLTFLSLTSKFYIIKLK